MNIQVEVFWVMTLSSDMVGYQRFTWRWKQQGTPKRW